MELLPPRIPNQELFALLTDCLAVRFDLAETAKLRLRLIDGTLSWQALVDLAADQGVILPLIWSLTRRSLMLPLPKTIGSSDGHPTARLQAVYQQHVTRWRAQCVQLSTIVAALNAAGIVPLVLKGARYLVAPAGAWCESREMRDIDLMVRADDGPRAVRALEAIGYAIDPRFLPTDQHLPEMWSSGQPSAVEIHTEALAFSGRKLLSTDEVWARADRLSIDTGSLFVLPNEWHLLHGLLNHQVSDRGHVRRTLALRPLWEFAMLGRELSDKDWRSIVGHMAARGGDGLLASWIVQASRLFGLSYPSWIEISPAARAHAEATLAHASAPHWLRRTYFVADQLRFGFAKETLAVRYRLAQSRVSFVTIGRHLLFLVHRYRGRMLRRLTGTGDRRS